ncbi:hypothetical protein P5E37_12845 [Vibrio parahaemolyticus]|nr:hypothetical protein [Vibrio parahaemolyticus]
MSTGYRCIRELIFACLCGKMERFTLCRVEVKKLYPNNGGLTFYTEYNDESVSICDGGYRFDIPASAPNYNTKVSVIMAAFMAKKKILIRYDAEQTKKCAAVVDRFLVKL